MTGFQSVHDGVHKRIHDVTFGYVRKGGKENRRNMVHLMHVFADFALANGHRNPEEFLTNKELFGRFCTSRNLSQKTQEDYSRANRKLLYLLVHEKITILS